jgi:hypothetical protein
MRQESGHGYIESPFIEVSLSHHHLRVKTVGKILRNSGSVFHIFRSFSYYSINTVIGMKRDMLSWESVGIRLGFHTVHFQIGRKNPIIF